MPSECRGLFVTGTDTDAGKTYVAALLVRHLRAQGWNVGACKPVVSGAIDRAAARHTSNPIAAAGDSDVAGEHRVWLDVEILRDACGPLIDEEAARKLAPQRFREPLAPPMAARREGRSVSWEAILECVAWWQNRVERLVIEGVGGLLCPLTDERTIADLAGALGCPLLIVARAELGTINHTLLTVEAARNRGLPLAGIVVNQTSSDTDAALVAGNIEEIERRSGVPVLAFVPYGATRLPEVHRDGTIPWSELFGRFVSPPG